MKSQGHTTIQLLTSQCLEVYYHEAHCNHLSTLSFLLYMFNIYINTYVN